MLCATNMLISFLFFFSLLFVIVFLQHFFASFCSVLIFASSVFIVCILNFMQNETIMCRTKKNVVKVRFSAPEVARCEARFFSASTIRHFSLSFYCKIRSTKKGKSKIIIICFAWPLNQFYFHIFFVPLRNDVTIFWKSIKTKAKPTIKCWY